MSPSPAGNGGKLSLRAARGVSSFVKTRGFSLLLLLVILTGGFFRLYDIRWDSGIMAHPDERSTIAFYAPTIHWPNSLEAALNPHQSPLNPFWDVSSQTRRSYTYGHFPLYLLVLVGNGLHSLGTFAVDAGVDPQTVDGLLQANTVPGFLDLGRGIVGLFDIGTIILVFLIARKLYGRWAGLLAATLSAFTVTQIQLAHFFAVDPISAMFTFLALYGAMLMAERDSTWPAALTGLAAGLAIASKFSALPIVAAPIMATVIAAWKARGHGRSYLTLVARLAVSGIVAMVAFAATSPYVLLDFQSFYTAVVQEQGAMVNGMADFPFTRQYRNTLPYVYFIEQEIRWGMGYALGLVAFVGLAWVALRGLVGRIRSDELILMSWVVPYFGITGMFLAKFMRYMSPLVPLFTIMGAGLLVTIWRRGSATRRLGRDVAHPRPRSDRRDPGGNDGLGAGVRPRRVRLGAPLGAGLQVDLRERPGRFPDRCGALGRQSAFRPVRRRQQYRRPRLPDGRVPDVRGRHGGEVRAGEAARPGIRLHHPLQQSAVSDDPDACRSAIR